MVLEFKVIRVKRKVGEIDEFGPEVNVTFLDKVRCELVVGLKDLCDDRDKSLWGYIHES